MKYDEKKIRAFSFPFKQYIERGERVWIILLLLSHSLNR
jgi:hypothetical protein